MNFCHLHHLRLQDFRVRLLLRIAILLLVLGQASQRPSGVFVQPTATFCSHLGPPRVDGQQEGPCQCVMGGVGYLCWPVLYSDCNANKHVLSSSISSSDPTIARRDVGSLSVKMSRAERIARVVGLFKNG